MNILHNPEQGARVELHSQGHTPVRDNVTGGTAAGSAGPSVTGNDFLTLLVTELKNQDPTANTDPNAYVNQLVQVNSLQQLIQINGNLTNSSHATTPTTPPQQS